MIAPQLTFFRTFGAKKKIIFFFLSFSGNFFRIFPFGSNFKSGAPKKKTKTTPDVYEANRIKNPKNRSEKRLFNFSLLFHESYNYRGFTVPLLFRKLKRGKKEFL